MRKSFSIVFLVAVTAVAIADDRMWPTELFGGDCVPMYIEAVKPPYVEKKEKEKCVENHSGSPDEIQLCLAQYRDLDMAVRFFTDRCGNGYFISLNDKEYELKRIGGNENIPPYLAGKFEGGGVQIKVSVVRLVKKIYEEGSRRTEEDVEDAKYEVLVTVTKGKRKQNIKGFLRYGR